MFVPTTAFLKDMIGMSASGLGSETFNLGACSIGLIAAEFVPGKDLKLSDLTEANFSGYTRKAIGTLTPVFNGPGNLMLTEGALLSWAGSDTITPNTIFGTFLVGSADSTTLKGTEHLNAPVPITGPDTRLTVVQRVGLDPAGQYGLSLAST